MRQCELTAVIAELNQLIERNELGKAILNTKTIDYAKRYFLDFMLFYFMGTVFFF